MICITKSEASNDFPKTNADNLRCMRLLKKLKDISILIYSAVSLSLLYIWKSSKDFGGIFTRSSIVVLLLA